MKIRLTLLSSLLGEDRNGHMRDVSISVHSVKDNTKVRVIRLSDNEPEDLFSAKLSGEIEFENDEDLHVLYIALHCTLPNSRDPCMLPQASAIVRPVDLIGKSSLVFYDQPSLDRVYHTGSPAAFRVVYRIPSKSAPPGTSTTTSPLLTRHDYASISRTLLKMRYPGFSMTVDPSLPSIRTGIEADRVITFSDWVGGLPFPFWHTMPRLTKTGGRFSRNYLRSAAEITHAWMGPECLDRSLRWAQMAAQVVTWMVPYVVNYRPLGSHDGIGLDRIPRSSSDESDLEHEAVRDFTTPVATWMNADCKGLAFLVASMWCALRDGEGLFGEGHPMRPEWERTREAMKALGPVLILYALVTEGGKRGAHLTCALSSSQARGKPATLSIDSVSPVMSFCKEDAEVECESVFGARHSLGVQSVVHDVRFERPAGRGTHFGRTTDVVWGYDEDGRAVFVEREPGRADGVPLGSLEPRHLRFVDSGKPEEKLSPAMLKPDPPFPFGRLSSTVVGRLSTISEKDSLTRPLSGSLRHVAGDFAKFERVLNNLDVAVRDRIVREVRCEKTGALFHVVHYYGKN
ncbi:MAG: hypothetical protein ACYCPS_06300 [Candidatus Saccharimonadales bacterium]